MRGRRASVAANGAGIEHRLQPGSRRRGYDSPILSWADTNWLRVCGYVVVAVLCFIAAHRENAGSPGAWPPFWILTGVLFLVMAIGRAGDVADLMTDSLRERAVSEGWYESRRDVQ